MTKTALVVGASGGIGRGIALRLARDGWKILAHGRHPGNLSETADLIRRTGAECQTISAELTDPEHLARLAGRANEEDDLGAVVVSAGGGHSVDSGPDALQEWDRTLAVILHAPMRLTALTLPRMKQTGGSYLYICGIYAKMGMARMAAHCAGRHGLDGFTKALFEEVREDGVGFTLLHPGFVHTSLSNTDTLDPEKMIAIDDIADMAHLAVTMPARACVTEMTVRPQRSPYR